VARAAKGVALSGRRGVAVGGNMYRYNHQNITDIIMLL